MINIVLFEPEIPQNTGNIMRTCIATGSILHLIKPLGFKINDKEIKRSGVNYIDKCNYFIYDNIDDFYNKNQGTYYYFTRYGHKPHDFFDYSNPKENIYFFFGKESTGIPTNLLKPHIDKCMRIPMTKDVRTLNLSNCVAIVIYEALRQQNYPHLLKDEPHKSKYFIEETK
ncbi:MAG: tRNA (cytidine(34)-2'-O)-methyltransferase [Mollicutes bacterium]|nr:tRNA (cytidine(34)-2'-O)-methyltransferase [Mollicutes bacterium]